MNKKRKLPPSRPLVGPTEPGSQPIEWAGGRAFCDDKDKDYSPQLPSPRRKSTGKAQRFRIFSRDNFTCRYCGRQSDVVPLHVDHIIPVCKGGTSDDENLITSCADCNLGKGGKEPTHQAPAEFDRLRLAQERNEQVCAAQAAADAAKAREMLRDTVGRHISWATGRRTVSAHTATLLAGYLGELGHDLVFKWIERAASKTNNDVDLGKYVSGCRRSHLAQKEISHA